ncbi:hypothetical protein [Caballeronia arvi]|uniref:hypothetical protein n=1 Tax=Caballeronia arvi TaxID=1777135 RepID=UPI00117CB21D|nr:hypothetical protein [Caballeronia arvi]
MIAILLIAGSPFFLTAFAPASPDRPVHHKGNKPRAIALSDLVFSDEYGDPRIGRRAAIIKSIRSKPMVMQFPGRFRAAGGISTHHCHNRNALSKTYVAVKLEAPRSFETRDSGDHRRAARSSLEASFQIEVRQNVMTLVYIAVPRRSITGRS